MPREIECDDQNKYKETSYSAPRTNMCNGDSYGT